MTGNNFSVGDSFYQKTLFSFTLQLHHPLEVFYITLQLIRTQILVRYLALVPFRIGASCPTSPLFAMWANPLGPHLQVCKMGKIQVKHKFLLWEIGWKQKRNTTLWRHHNLDELWFHSSQVAVTSQTLICNNSLVLRSVKNKKQQTNQWRKTPKAKKPQTNQIKKPSPNPKNSPKPQQANTKNPEENYFTF